MTENSEERASPEQVKAAINSITEVFEEITIRHRRMEILQKLHKAALAGTFDAEAADQMLADHQMPAGLRADTIEYFSALLGSAKLRRDLGLTDLGL